LSRPDLQPPASSQRCRCATAAQKRAACGAFFFNRRVRSAEPARASGGLYVAKCSRTALEEPAHASGSVHTHTATRWSLTNTFLAHIELFLIKQSVLFQWRLTQRFFRSEAITDRQQEREEINEQLIIPEVANRSDSSP